MIKNFIQTLSDQISALEQEKNRSKVKLTPVQNQPSHSNRVASVAHPQTKNQQLRHFGRFRRIPKTQNGRDPRGLQLIAQCVRIWIIRKVDFHQEKGVTVKSKTKDDEPNQRNQCDNFEFGFSSVFKTDFAEEEPARVRITEALEQIPWKRKSSQCRTSNAQKRVNFYEEDSASSDEDSSSGSN